MIAGNADGHRIISTVFGKNAGNISTYQRLFFLHGYIKGFIIVCINNGFGGLVVSMLASGTQGGFDPGRSRRIFRAKKSTACLPWGGSKAVSHVADLRGMSKNPGFMWKSKSQAKLTGHFSPIIPSFADRGLSCRLHVEAPRGESGNV